MIDPEATLPETFELTAVGAGIGAQIGRFTLASVLGAGGMGVVFAAHDPVLDRRIAIKLILEARTAGGAPDLDSGAENEARLLREAQALARLSHPHVVTVYEAGVAGRSVYIAMELLEGGTLREWLAGPHGWREVVAVFVEAGRGLAAAHAAGLVHRDFKPANVLIDAATGAVKVGDFGLANVVGEHRGFALGSSPGAAGGHIRVTRTGAVAGTPAYMAPEQVTGGPVDARADQYAFCTALAEALADRRGVPRAVRAVIARGRQRAREARFPTLDALLAALERAARRRRIAAWSAAGAVAAVVVAVLALRGGGERDACVGAGVLAGAWDDARAARLAGVLAARDPVRGWQRFAIARGALATHATAWRAASVGACRANRRGVESDLLYERRLACLERRRAGIAGAAAALEGARAPEAIDHAVSAVVGLTGAEACADREALLAAQPPPEDPARRREVAAVTAALDEIDQLRAQGDQDGLLARAVAAVARARATEHPPVLAAALRAQAEVAFDIDAGIDAQDELRELSEVAARAHDDATAVWAFSQLIHVLAIDGGRPAEALALVPAARAALLRAGEPLDARIDFLYTHALVLGAAQRLPEALAELDAARAALVAAGAEQPGSPRLARLAQVSWARGSLLHDAGRYAEAIGWLRAATAQWIRAYGPDHLDVAWGWASLGDAFRYLRRGDEAVAAYREAARIRKARLGETNTLAVTYVTFSYQLLELGQLTEAHALIVRAVEILRTRGGRRQLAMALMSLGLSFAAQHDDGDARTAYDEALAVFSELGGEDNNHPITLVNRADLAARANRCRDALPDYARARELFAVYAGPAHWYQYAAMVPHARCQILLGEPAAALAELDRLAQLGAPGVDPLLAAQATFLRGRALVESGRDRRGGLAIARTGRAAIAAVGDGQVTTREALADADAWLATAR